MGECLTGPIAFTSLKLLNYDWRLHSILLIFIGGVTVVML